MITNKRRSMPFSLRSLRLLLAITAVFAGLSAFETATSQIRSVIGLSGGYDFGVPLAFERDPARISWCECPGTGRSSSHTTWLGGFILFPDLLLEGAGGGFRLNLEYSSGSFRSDQYTTPPFLDPEVNRVITALARFDARGDFLSLRADALTSIGLTDYVKLEAGPWIRFRLLSRFTQTEHILAPEDASFPQSGRSDRVAAQGDEIAANALSAGAFAAFRFTSPISEHIDLYWDVHSQLDLRALSQHLSTRSFTIGVGMSLALRATRPVKDVETDAPPPPPVIAPDPAPADTARSIEATISLYSLSPSGERIRHALVQSSQHYFRNSVPVLATIFFDRNSAQIPGRYSQISRSARFSFSNRRLIRRDAVEHYHQLLNIIGMRLNEDPSASIAVIGAASPDEPPALAHARAEAVMIYLRTIWDVSPSRMRIEIRATRPHHYSPPEQMRSVEITASTRSLLDPVVTDWMVESFNTTPIGLDPGVSDPDALRDWTITIAHQNREVARYSSSDGSKERELDIGLLLRDADASSAIPPLVAWFSVEDSTGEVTTVTDALDIVFSSDSSTGAGVSDVRVTTTNVFRTSDLVVSGDGPPNRDLLRELAGRLSDGDRVIIRPVVEITGGAMATEQAVRAEVQRLANAMLIELGNKDVGIRIERGASFAGRGREHPENALLSRLIAVTLERRIAEKR